MLTLTVSFLGILIAINTFILIYRNRGFGLLLIFVCIILNAIFNNKPPSIEIFTFRLQFSDAVSLILFVILLIDIISGKITPNLILNLLLFFGFYCLASLSIGVFYHHYGLGKAIGYFYLYFYYFVIGGYTYTYIQSISRFNAFYKFWFWTAIVLCFIAIIKWGMISFLGM